MKIYKESDLVLIEFIVMKSLNKNLSLIQKLMKRMITGL